MKKNRKINVVNVYFKGIAIFILASIILQVKITVYADPEEYQEMWQSQRTILLDPGHGGIDSGGVSKKGTLEKDINLIISKKTKALLEAEGYKVIMTREEDKGLYTDSGTIRKKKIEDLDNRLKMKKETDNDMFISIHLNMFPQSKYYGAQVWYGANKESEKLGGIMRQSFIEYLDKENKRNIKPAREAFKILLDNGNKPAILAECGFLSNSNEEQKLCSDEYQEKIAAAILQSVNLYFGLNN